VQRTFDILHLFVAPEHSYWHLEDPSRAAVHPMRALQSAECVAGKGLRGDRYFGHKENYKGQVTFHAAEVFEAVCRHVGAEDCPPWITRRNVITRGLDLNELVGRTFRVGDARFQGVEECAPCAWMDRAIGAGAREFLEGRGGLRARILADGLLRVGRLVLEIEPLRDDSGAGAGRGARQQGA